MSFLRKSVLVLVLISVATGSFSQIKTAKQLQASVLRFIENDKKDSAYIEIANFRKQTGLTNNDRFICDFYYGELLVSLNRLNEAVEAYRQARTSLSENEQAGLCAMADTRIASAYFTLQNFDSAFFYCNRSYSRLAQDRRGYRGENREMAGYYYFIHGMYGPALKAYNEALACYAGLEGVSCANSSVYNKLALIYSKTRRFEEALEVARKAIGMADSCGGEALILSYISLTNIYKDAGKLREAMACKAIVDSLNSLKTTQAQQEKVLELEAKYQNKLKEQENEALKKVNLEKEEVVKQQQNVIIISIITIVLFTGLLFFLIRAINQRNRSNRELQLQKNRIESVNKDLERLNLLNQKIFSVISHDFKGPVLTLQLLLETFRKKNNDTQLAPYIDDIGAQLQNAGEIMSNLLNWAKTEINISVADNPSTELKTLVGEIADQLKTPAGNKNIMIHYEVQNKIKVMVPDDIVRIVLRNLLSNAIKFSHPGSEIKLVYEHSEGRLLVSDTGVGMTEEKLNKLFKKDVMPSFGTSSEGGFGMGLYIVAELLHKYKSSITATSTEGKGTTFIVTFPLA